MSRKYKIFGSFLALTLLLGGTASLSKSGPLKTNAATFDESLTRISLVRPTGWSGSSAKQILLIGNSASDFDASGKKFIDHKSEMNAFVNLNLTNAKTSTAWVGDDHYKSGGTFTEYDTDGILFYDVKISEIEGKWFSFVRTAPPNTDNWGQIWNMVPPRQYSASEGNKLIRIWGNFSGSNSASKAEASNIGDGAMAAILYGFMTCAPSEHNGYLAYPQLDGIYDLEKRFVSTTTLKDFVDKNDYVEGKTVDNTADVSVGTKVAMMKEMYLNSIPGGVQAPLQRKDNNVLTVSLISAIGITLITGWFLFSKKTKTGKN